MTQERKTAEIIPWEVFSQMRLNRHMLNNPHKPLHLPKPAPVIDDEFDDAPVFDKSLFWGVSQDHYEKQRLLNRYFAEQSDPDETGI